MALVAFEDTSYGLKSRPSYLPEAEMTFLRFDE